MLLQAQAVFDGLVSAGLTPDAASYGALMRAYHRAGQWVQLGCVYEAMMAAGHKPSSEQHSFVIGALWASGTPWGQAKAAQYFKEASRSVCGGPDGVSKGGWVNGWRWSQRERKKP